MATTGVHGREDAKAAPNTVFHVEEQSVSSRHGEPKLRDSGLESLSPMIKNMRLFGLHFTGKSRVGPVGFQPSVEGRRRWNGARIYATVMLVVTCLNCVRVAVIFDATDPFGAQLFQKLATVSYVALNLFMHAAYYVATTATTSSTAFARIM